MGEKTREFKYFLLALFLFVYPKKEEESDLYLIFLPSPAITIRYKSTVICAQSLYKCIKKLR